MAKLETKRSTRHILYAIGVIFCYLPNFCSAACSQPGRNGIVEYTGTNLKLSDIVLCSRGHRGASLITIQSFDNLTIDVDYPAVGGAKEPSLLLLTRKLIAAGQKTFNLAGTNGSHPSSLPGSPGRPGAPGETAGSVILAFSEGPPAGTLNFVLDGGNGGAGQSGANGKNGENGAHRPFKQFNDAYCSAWRGGWTKVWLTPNRCYERMDNQGRCHADDSGARWDIYGTDGKPGSNGYDGGAGGRGGNPGISLVADISAGKNSTKIGSVGQDGLGGQGGLGGKGGKKGDTNSITVDDANGSKGKRCKQKSQSYVSVNEFARDGSNGKVGGNCCGQTPSPPFPIRDFAPHIQSYVNKCIDRASNMQDLALLKFCNEVRSHFHL